MNPNVKLIYTTRSNQQKPSQLVFHIKDNDGNDHIVTAVIPSAADLLDACDQKGWVRQGQGQFSQSQYGQRRSQAA